MKYWMHRISYCWKYTKPLLDEGYLSIGWDGLGKNNESANTILSWKKDAYAIADKLKAAPFGDETRTRFDLARFLCIQDGDRIVVPLPGGQFVICEAEGRPIPVTEIYNKTSCNGLQDEHIDIGFVIKVHKLCEVKTRQVADSALYARMCARQTTLSCDDIGNEIEKAIKRDEPPKLKNELVDAAKDALKKALKGYTNPNHLEQIVKWYMQRIGADTVDIPPKNGPDKVGEADADVTAVFEKLKLIIYIQVKFHSQYTNDWAVKQIKSYREQHQSIDNDYQTVSWVISTADGFSDDARKLAQEHSVRLIDGDEFSDMLLTAGIDGIPDKM